MSDSVRAPDAVPAGAHRLLTIAQAAAETSLSAKAIARRIERGTLFALRDKRGRRVVPLCELERAGLLSHGHARVPAGELVIWRELYERERESRERLAVRERELHAQLAAIANAGPIRAMRLRRDVRRRLEADGSTAARPANTYRAPLAAGAKTSSRPGIATRFWTMSSGTPASVDRFVRHRGRRAVVARSPR